VDEIDGGFTMTGRTLPNAFNVRAVYAWRVYAGRTARRARARVDLIGTPLVALTNVMAAGRHARRVQRILRRRERLGAEQRGRSADPLPPTRGAEEGDRAPTGPPLLPKPHGRKDA
jgi:hypothetical protein